MQMWWSEQRRGRVRHAGVVLREESACRGQCGIKELGVLVEQGSGGAWVSITLHVLW